MSWTILSLSKSNVYFSNIKFRIKRPDVSYLQTYTAIYMPSQNKHIRNIQYPNGLVVQGFLYVLERFYSLSATSHVLKFVYLLGLIDGKYRHWTQTWYAHLRRIFTSACKSVLLKEIQLALCWTFQLWSPINAKEKTFSAIHCWWSWVLNDKWLSGRSLRTEDYNSPVRNINWIRDLQYAFLLFKKDTFFLH